MKSLKITLLALVVVALTVSVYGNPNTASNVDEPTFKVEKPTYDLIVKNKKKKDTPGAA